MELILLLKKIINVFLFYITLTSELFIIVLAVLNLILSNYVFHKITVTNCKRIVRFLNFKMTEAFKTDANHPNYNFNVIYWIY